MSSLPKTVTRQRRDCDVNPGRSAPESSTLCLSGSMSLNTISFLPNFCAVCMLCVVVIRTYSGDFAIHSFLSVICMTSYLHIMVRNR